MTALIGLAFLVFFIVTFLTETTYTLTSRRRRRSESLIAEVRLELHPWQFLFASGVYFLIATIFLTDAVARFALTCTSGEISCINSGAAVIREITSSFGKEDARYVLVALAALCFTVMPTLLSIKRALYRR